MQVRIKYIKKETNQNESKSIFFHEVPIRNARKCGAQNCAGNVRWFVHRGIGHAPSWSLRISSLRGSNANPHYGLTLFTYHIPVVEPLLYYCLRRSLNVSGSSKKVTHGRRDKHGINKHRTLNDENFTSLPRLEYNRRLMNLKSRQTLTGVCLSYIELTSYNALAYCPTIFACKNRHDTLIDMSPTN